MLYVMQLEGRLMGINYITKLVKEKQVLGFTCNRCGKTFIDDMDIQEMVYHKDTGGYCCAFGDGIEYEICLCTKCAYKILGEYTEYVDRGMSLVN